MSAASPARALEPGVSRGAGARLVIDDVHKRYGPVGNHVLALGGISLTVDPGEFVCLVGASGCGKSTLLNLVAGLDQPSRGTVDVGTAHTTLMFQEAALFPWLTAGQNISLALKYSGVPKGKRKNRIEELLDLVRLSGHSDRR
ncbi:MAG TPA: ATP-binding cassette domain-containing protein, partial [Candidatus Limnocylindria bacterium]|nr:ATP-binding cassette domain-containing protein [Candidatus Limnocylindria bacterium]